MKHTPFQGERVTKREAWNFALAIMAAFPGAEWTVFDGQGREVANNRLPVAR